jgi:hypothetical protein
MSARPPWPVLLLLTSRGPQGEALPLPARCPAQRPPPLPAAAAGAHRRPCDVAPGDTRTFHDQNRSSDCDSPTFLFTSSSVLIMMIGAASSSGASAPCGPAGRTSDCRMRRQVRGLIGSPCLGVCTHRDPIMCARAPCSWWSPACENRPHAFANNTAGGRAYACLPGLPDPAQEPGKMT